MKTTSLAVWSHFAPEAGAGFWALFARFLVFKSTNFWATYANEGKPTPRPRH